MKQLFISLYFLFVAPAFLSAQCNGFPELCDLRYNQVSYLTTHNAFNAGDEGFQLPNQNQGLTGQLNGGVRGFMLDVYDEGGVPTVYHGFALLGTAPLSDNLAEIKNFLDANPNEIITIIFESYVGANLMEGAFDAVGLLPYLHEQTLGSAWPTLQQMIDAGTRLVVFSDSDDANPNQGWYNYVWDFAVETGFSNNAPSDFSCDFNRGDSINELFILNHFVTNAVVGTGNPDQSAIVNAYDFFYPRAINCWNEKQKFPNFPTVDFYELGDTKRVVDSLNLNSPALAIVDKESLRIQLLSLGNGLYRAIHGDTEKALQIEVYNAQGLLIDRFNSNTRNQFLVNLSGFSSGLYFIRIADKMRLNARIVKVLR